MTPQKGMNRALRCMVPLLLVLASVAQAETRYVDDVIYVPVRSGPSNEYRIIESALRSGTPVEVLEEDAENDYSRVRFGDDEEGYIATRFLSSERIAEDRLQDVQQQLASTEEELSGARSQLEETRSELEQVQQEKQSLESELNETSDELERIRTISEDAINLEKRNRELREERQELRKEVELLTNENQRLEDSRESSYLLTGGGLVIAGIFIAVIFPLLKPSRKSENWA
ncbi:TIGR04211 family SH3 domain-containing protein [Vreelandella utahensis]|uniref:TIGR04211 family SH3 domain-containing protein n=1 Tax=Vreelandella halophila TaxID=86177 RepID=UPI0009856B9F|nr:TIGR04211 family SH3 domain-containing protein [Halomonas utahensis]